MSTLRSSAAVRTVAAWLCATLSIGCSAPQLRPLPGDCPPQTVRLMKELKFMGGGAFTVFLDPNQEGGLFDEGTYRPGPIVSRLSREHTKPSIQDDLPDGTLFYGQLWTEGLTFGGADAVYVRYTEAVLPNGLHVPICFAFSDGPTGLLRKLPGSKPGAARLPRAVYIEAVEWWP